MTTPQVVVDRLLSRYDVDPAGCWISQYSAGSHGYSQIGWQVDAKRQTRLGHRLSWESHNGPIPAGMTIDHLCRVRKCINPAHLRLLGNRDNAAGGGGKHVTPGVWTGRLCGLGLHPLLRFPSGATACRECSNRRLRQKRSKSRGN